jgi:hypothetical protein
MVREAVSSPQRKLLDGSVARVAGVPLPTGTSQWSRGKVLLAANGLFMLFVVILLSIVIWPVTGSPQTASDSGQSRPNTADTSSRTAETSLERELQESKSEIVRLKTALEGEKNKAATLSKELAETKTALADHQALLEGARIVDRSQEAALAKAKKEIARLEAELEKTNKSEGTASKPAGKEGWRKLKRGMSEKDVQKLLGEPLKVVTEQSIIKAPTTAWYYKEPPFGLYPPGAVCIDGSVRFADGKLVEWREP